jgi:hypothetical protein
MPEPKHTPKELNGQTGFKRVCFVRGENTLIGLSEFKRVSMLAASIKSFQHENT